MICVQLMLDFGLSCFWKKVFYLCNLSIRADYRLVSSINDLVDTNM